MGSKQRWIRETTKKVLILEAGPLRKNNFCWSSRKKIRKNLTATLEVQLYTMYFDFTPNFQMKDVGLSLCLYILSLAQHDIVMSFHMCIKFIVSFKNWMRRTGLKNKSNKNIVFYLEFKKKMRIGYIFQNISKCMNSKDLMILSYLICHRASSQGPWIWITLRFDFPELSLMFSHLFILKDNLPPFTLFIAKMNSFDR